MQQYSYDEAFQASKDYFKGDELAAKVFVDKYALQDSEGHFLEKTPSDMHHRLAKEFARIESKYPNAMSEDEIYDLLDGFKYVVPQGSPMFGIGNPYQVVSLSNCYVLESPHDSYAGILKTDQEQAHVYRRRGGIGFDISNIRPKGLSINNAAKTTDGIGLFMERFSTTCREVAQGGRRGALLLSISCHHPEIRTFINIKKNLQKVTGANISVRLTDEFMQAVKNKEKVQLRWPVDAKDPKISAYEDAEALWSELCEAAHASAEPGLLFWDNALNYTPAQVYKDYGFNHTSTNPCGEIILSPGDSCRLLLVNLCNFVERPFEAEAQFNFEKFADVVVKAQRLMDDLIDLELECIDRILAKVDADPEPAEVKIIEKNLWLKIKKACIDGRRTGLGITALGDCLAYLGIRYGSEESIEMTEKIYKALAINSYKSSCLMAQERGAFPIFSKDLEHNHPFLQRIWEAAPEVYELYQKYGRRNIANTTTAPAGSVSTLTQTTSGIEPVYMLSYTRRKKINPDSKNVKVDFVDPVGDSWQEYKVYHHGVKKWMQMTGQEDAEKSPYYLATAMDCDWQAGVRLQAAAQKWICHSISRTANVPNSASVQLIKDIYMMAWEHGCKGYTVYRDGCRTGVLVSEETYAKQKSTDTDGRPLKITQVMAPKRPKELICDIHHVTVKGVKWTALVGLLQGEPYELFMGKSEDLIVANKHKTGKIIKVSRGRYNLYLEDESKPLIENIVQTLDDNEIAWATRMISTSLRHGIGVEYLVEQLSKEGSVVDVNNVLARILKKYIKEGTRKKDQCPQCGGDDLIYEEKCKRCVNVECGWSGCS